MPMCLTHHQEMVRQLQPSALAHHATIRIDYKATNLVNLPFLCRPDSFNFQQMASLCLYLDHVARVSQLNATFVL